MRSFVLALGALATIGLSLPAVSTAQAETVVIKHGDRGMHRDRGLHRGWEHRHHHDRVVIIKRGHRHHD